MYRSGREQRRAAMTAGASFVAGALLVVTAAVGGIISHPSDIGTGTVGSGSAASPNPPLHQASLPAPHTRPVAAASHSPACTDPAPSGSGRPLPPPVAWPT